MMCPFSRRVMYTDYTLDDILEILEPLDQSVDEPIRHLEEKHKKILHLCREDLDEIQSNKELQTDFQKLIEKQCMIQITNKNELEQNSLYLQNLENTTADLKKEMLQKENELLQLEKEVDTIKKKLKSTLDVREDISRKKDIILAYKLLTNTSFVYNTKKTTGIVTKKSTVRSFSFNPEELTQEEITQKLWDLVLEDNK